MCDFRLRVWYILWIGVLDWLDIIDFRVFDYLFIGFLVVFIIVVIIFILVEF